MIPICREPIVFFAGARSSAARKARISLTDLKHFPLWMANRDGVYNECLQRLCKKSGVYVQPRKYVDSGTLLKQLVADNDCVSMISKIAIASELKAGTLVELSWDGEPLYVEVIAVVRKGDDSKLCDEFIHIVQNLQKPQHQVIYQ